MIKFNIPTTDWISFPALGGTVVFISGIVNPIINGVEFLFWVSVQIVRGEAEAEKTRTGIWLIRQ